MSRGKWKEFLSGVASAYLVPRKLAAFPNIFLIFIFKFETFNPRLHCPVVACLFACLFVWFGGFNLCFPASALGDQKQRRRTDCLYLTFSGLFPYRPRKTLLKKN